MATTPARWRIWSSIERLKASTFSASMRRSASP
jgi:hypothetical protein